MAKLKIFDELMEGVAAMKSHLEGKVTLRGRNTTSHSCEKAPATTCGKAPLNTGRNLSALIRSYTIYNRPRSLDDLKHFQRMPSLANAIESAALAKGPCGKRCDHQRRLTRTALSCSNALLLGVARKIARCRSFDALHTLVLDTVGAIDGIGELYIYDTSLRIGAHLNVFPQRVYLHAGTRQGAKALGIAGPRISVSVDELPVELRKLEPHEIEDLLCIYKAELGL
jgi:hypothetical protein